MDVFGYIRRLLTVTRTRFPRAINEHAYCMSWYLYLGQLRDAGIFTGRTLNTSSVPQPREGKPAFNHYRMGFYNNDKSGLVDGLVPAMRIGNRVGLYRVSRRYRKSFHYDLALWDDGHVVDLVFVKSVAYQPPTEGNE